MASYLQDGIGVFPQEQGFTPNYNFIMKALEMRQEQYNQGFSQIKNVYNSVLNAEMLGEDNKQRRDQIVSNAKKALQDLPMVDLSIAKNVTAAESVFKPFYEDTDILADIGYTKESKTNLSKGMSLQNAEKEEDRKRYWSIGIQDIYDGMDEFKNATPEQRRNMRARKYVAKPQISEEVLKMFNEGKLKRSVDQISGQIKYTTENGEQLIEPLTNLYLSKAFNDPEAMEGFNVYGRVTRNKFIRENTQNGRFPSRDVAAKAHDEALVKDYLDLQDRRVAETTKSVGLLDERIKILNGKLADGTLTEEEKGKLIRDEIQRENLNKQIQGFKDNKLNAKERIMGNPESYLGNMYLHKAANDLATSLSAFGSEKIESNPLYKDFVHPLKLKEFETQQNMILENLKSENNMKEETHKAQLKVLYGDSDGSGDGKSSSDKKSAIKINELNVPEVTQDVASSGVEFRTPTGKPDSYEQQMKYKNETITSYADAKANLIFEVLSPGEIKDAKGNLLDQTQMRMLSKKPEMLDKLYKDAIDKYNIISKDPTNPKAQKARRMMEEITAKRDLWNATDVYTRDNLKNIVANLEASETYAERKVVRQKQTLGSAASGGGGKPEVETVVEPGKYEGWIYKHLLKDGTLIGTDDYSKSMFINNIKKDPEFMKYVNQRYPSKDGKPSKFDTPFEKQIVTSVIVELQNNLSKFRNRVVEKWNDQGLNFFGRYSGGGGGTTARTVTYRGSKEVQGETADKYTLDLLGKIVSLKGDTDMTVSAGPNKIKGYKDNDEDLLKLIQNGALSNEVLNSIKLGKTAGMDYYSISSTQVGGGNPAYNAYTLTFDPKFISQMQGTENKPGLITNEQATKLANGLTIYIKKDKDQSAFSQASRLSEIDVLINSNPQGVFKRSVHPGYGIEIVKNPLTNGYKMKTHYLKISPDDLEGEHFEEEMDVPPSTDLSSLYYETYEGLNNLLYRTETAKKDFRKAEVAVNPAKKITREDIEREKREILSRQGLL